MEVQLNMNIRSLGPISEMDMVRSGDIVSLVVVSNAHSLPMLMVFLCAFLLLNVKFIQGTVSQQ